MPTIEIAHFTILLSIAIKNIDKTEVFLEYEILIRGRGN